MPLAVVEEREVSSGSVGWGESEAGGKKANGVKFRGAADGLPSSPWTAAKVRHAVRSLILYSRV